LKFVFARPCVTRTLEISVVKIRDQENKIRKLWVVIYGCNNTDSQSKVSTSDPGLLYFLRKKCI